MAGDLRLAFSQRVRAWAGVAWPMTVLAVAACGARSPANVPLATLQTQPPMVADELRRQADNFIDLVDLSDFIERADGSHQHAQVISDAPIMAKV
jgi:hypothetical protein